MKKGSRVYCFVFSFSKRKHSSRMRTDCLPTISRCPSERGGVDPSRPGGSPGWQSFQVGKIVLSEVAGGNQNFSLPSKVKKLVVNISFGLNRYLVAATTTVDTHPTGMHSCYKRSFGQSNVFTLVCHSVHGEGVCIWRERGLLSSRGQGNVFHASLTNYSSQQVEMSSR